MKNKLDKVLYIFEEKEGCEYPLIKKLTEESINGYWNNENDFDIDKALYIMKIYKDYEIKEEFEICTIKAKIKYAKNRMSNCKDDEFYEIYNNLYDELINYNEDYIIVPFYNIYGGISLVYNHEYNIVGEINF